MFHSSPSPPLFAVLLQCPCRRLFSLRASACPTFTMGKIYHFADEESTLSPRWRLFIFPLQRLADWELDIQVITGVSRFPPLRITLAATYCTVAQFYLGVALVPSSLLIIRVCVCVCVCVCVLQMWRWRRRNMADDEIFSQSDQRRRRERFKQGGDIVHLEPCDEQMSTRSVSGRSCRSRTDAPSLVPPRTPWSTSPALISLLM